MHLRPSRRDSRTHYQSYDPKTKLVVGCLNSAVPCRPLFLTKAPIDFGRLSSLANVVTDGHHDRDFLASEFRRWRRQWLRARNQRQRRLIEQTKTRTMSDAGVVHTAMAIDAEG